MAGAHVAGCARGNSVDTVATLLGGATNSIHRHLGYNLEEELAVTERLSSACRGASATFSPFRIRMKVTAQECLITAKEIAALIEEDRVFKIDEPSEILDTKGPTWFIFLLASDFATRSTIFGRLRINAIENLIYRTVKLGKLERNQLAEL